MSGFIYFIYSSYYFYFGKLNKFIFWKLLKPFKNHERTNFTRCRIRNNNSPQNIESYETSHYSLFAWYDTCDFVLQRIMYASLSPSRNISKTTRHEFLSLFVSNNAAIVEFRTVINKFERSSSWQKSRSQLAKDVTVR